MTLGSRVRYARGGDDRPVPCAGHGGRPATVPQARLAPQAQANSAATKASGSNGQEVADLLPHPDEADRHAERVLDGEDDAALGRRVELGEHDAGEAGRLVEGPRLGEAVLPGRGVEDEEDLGRARRAGAGR